MASFRCLFGWHTRSTRDRYRDALGRYRSCCKRCGRDMVRVPHTQRWVAYAPRDRRARLRPVAAWLDRMTGPILFLLALASFLGLVLWLHGPPVSPPPARASHARR